MIAGCIPTKSESILRRGAQRLYRLVRQAAWKLPITRWPPAADVAVRLGFWARRLLRLAPQTEALGIVNGHRMWFGPNSECFLDMTQGRWEPGVTRLIETVVRPGMTVVDVGAHIGYFSLLAARQVGPSGHVYAFEPAPENFALLTRNITGNGYQQVVATRKAISDHPGVQTLFLHQDSVAHSLQKETISRVQASLQIETTTLDQFFAALGWPAVEVAKLDIEGGEPPAIEGMSELLARNRHARLILEFIPHILRRAGRDPRTFLASLRHRGFRIHMITDAHGLVEFRDRWSENMELHAELWCEPVPD